MERFLELAQAVVFRRVVSAVCYFMADFFKRLLHPPRAALGEDRLKMTLKQSTGVLKILFGVLFGLG